MGDHPHGPHPQRVAQLDAIMLDLPGLVKALRDAGVLPQ